MQRILLLALIGVLVACGARKGLVEGARAEFANLCGYDLRLTVDAKSTVPLFSGQTLVMVLDPGLHTGKIELVNDPTGAGGSEFYFSPPVAVAFTRAEQPQPWSCVVTERPLEPQARDAP